MPNSHFMSVELNGELITFSRLSSISAWRYGYSVLEIPVFYRRAEN